MSNRRTGKGSVKGNTESSFPLNEPASGNEKNLKAYTKRGRNVKLRHSKNGKSVLEAAKRGDEMSSSGCTGKEGPDNKEGRPWRKPNSWGLTLQRRGG